MAGNAHHQRGKYQRRDDGFYEAQKGVAQDLKVHGHAGSVVAQLDADQHAHHNPESKRAPGSHGGGNGQNGQPASRNRHGGRQSYYIIGSQYGKNAGENHQQNCNEG